MAKGQDVEQAATTTNGNDDAGWIKLKTDRPVYKAERGKGDTVQGYLLGMIDMPPANGKPWQALIVQLTKPCKCTGRDDKVTTVQAGEEILVPANHQLQQHLAKAAMHGKLAYEAKICPKGQTKTAAGSMNVFELAINPRPIHRNDAQRLVAVQSAAPPQLAAGDDEAPF